MKKVYRSIELEELFFYTLYNFNAYWEIGTVSSEVACRISNRTGYDTNQYSIRLYNTELKHILARHFFETNQAQRNVCFEDMKKFDVIINQPTTISNGNKENSIVFTKYLSFVNEQVVLVAEIDRRKKIMLVKTCWIKRKK